jgi:hypothetical protein
MDQFGRQPAAGTAPIAWSPTARLCWTCRRSCPHRPEFATGQGRKTDSVDAHSVAVVALRTPGLRQVAVDDTTGEAGLR